MNGPTRKMSAAPASEVPTSTGATAAGSVRIRAAMSQMRSDDVLEAVAAMRADYGRLGNFEKSGRRFSR